MGAYARFAATCILGVSGYVSQGVANAADLVILTNQGAAPGVRELAAEFERVSGHRITVIQPDDATLEQLINDGTADLVTGNPDLMEERVRDGKVLAGTVTPFVLAGLGLSVRAGAPKPDITSVESYAAALLAAESIGYSRGCSGTHAVSYTPLTLPTKA